MNSSERKHGSTRKRKELQEVDVRLERRIRTLAAEAFDIHRSDPHQGLALASEACKLAEKYGDAPGEAEAHYTISCCLDTLSEYDAALEHANKALELYRKIEDKEGEGKVRNTIGITCQNNGKLAEALASFSAAREIFQELNNPIRLATAHNNIGGIHDSIGNYHSALESYLQALQIYEREGQEEYAAMVQYNIGSIYYHLGRDFNDYTKALEYFGNSRETLERLKSHYSLALTLNGIASVYIAQEEYDSAREMLKEVSDIFAGIGELRLQATILVEIGIIDEKQGDHGKALDRFREAADRLRSLNVLQDYGAAQYQIGSLHYNLGQHAQAIEALNEGLRALETSRVIKMEKEIRWILAMAYREEGNMEESVRQLLLHRDLMTEQFSQERQEATARMQAGFDVERAEREREVFRQQALQMEELARQRSKELSTTAMLLAGKNTFLQRLRNDLRELPGKSEEHIRGVMAQLLSQIEESLRSDDDWQRFEEMYQLVHHDFIQSLSEGHPNLSSTELKICSLMHINLSNKEIADLLCVSSRTIESHRYRIRKKLGLSSEVNLTRYMARL